LNGDDGYGTNHVKNVIKGKSVEEFASAEMATLLNNNRTGANAPWEYIADSDYPTLKFERADYDPDHDQTQSDTYEHIAMPTGYGGTKALEGDTLTVTADEGYRIDVIYIDGVHATETQAVPTEGGTVHGATSATIDLSSGYNEVKSIVATFAYCKF
jgi:hypothetical protein